MLEARLMDEMDRRNAAEDPTIMGNDVPREPMPDDRDVTARPVRDEATTADYVGEAAGGVSGGLAGAAIGSIGGPVGTLIGGLAGVIGGWWAGRSIAEAAKDYGDVDDRYYRTHYERGRNSSRSFDDVRPVYQLGHLASRNPDYRGQDFDTVEPDLRRGWSDEIGARHGDWSSVRDYAREGYARGTSTLAATSAGAIDSSVRRSEQLDRSGDHSAHAADRVADMEHRLGDATRRGAHKVADAVDNVKDRIDGNPASKPGPDPTDRRP
jgi:hypothetical protein